MKKRKLLIGLAAFLIILIGLVGFRSYRVYQVKKYLKSLTPEKMLKIEATNIIVDAGYDNQEALDKATKKLKEAIEINPNYAEAYYKLGNIYVAQKMFKEAEAVWKKAIEIDPSSKKAQEHLKKIETQKMREEGWKLLAKDQLSQEERERLDYLANQLIEKYK